MLNFDQNMIIPALTGEKLDKIWRKNIPITYLSKIRQLLAKKPVAGTQADFFMLRKKPQNNFFLRGPQHCENGIWNIKIFASIFDQLFISQNWHFQILIKIEQKLGLYFETFWNSLFPLPDPLCIGWICEKKCDSSSYLQKIYS